MRRLLFLLLLASCRPSGEVAEPTTVSVGDEPAAPVVEHRRTGEPTAVAPLEVAGTDLGRPCSIGEDRCGEAGRIAWWEDPRNGVLGKQLPCTPRRVAEMAKGHDLSACVHQGVIYAAGQCIICRLMNAGWTVIAAPEELTQPQRLDLSARLGFGSEAPRDLAGWREAIDAAAEEHDVQPLSP
ncbi:MAG: hypothetical protein KC731_01180 [Myxococcales bacterium]|mgnify:CR=1 FL=1|nr:hypothetical protein [Myxococcales bacterium]